MAPARVVSADRSKIPSNKVSVYCNICHSPIGVFKNEWIRLTSAYARPKDKGTSFGTRVGDITRTVPDGVAHKMAAGCSMAELFCEGCDTVVGQYCKHAPDRKREKMVGQYFYKFSKTQLKDAKTAKAVEPIFAVGSEDLSGTPRARSSAVAPANTSSPLPRPGTALAPKSSPPHSIGYHTRDQQDGGNDSPLLNGAAENQNGLMNRLMDLERLVRAGSFAAPAVQSRAEVKPLQSYAHEPYGYSPSGVNEQIIEDQKKQIETMTAQMNTLRGTIDDLRGVIQDLRAEKARQQSASLQESAMLNHFEKMIRSVRDTHSTNAETDSLRSENQLLKERLSTIAGAIGVSANESSQDGRSSQQHEQDWETSLGKRKREDEHPSRMGSRPGDSYHPNEQHFANIGGDAFHPLTPESMQEMAATRGPTPAGRPLPPIQTYPPSNPHYAPQHLRFNFSDPNLRQYGTEAPSSAYQATYYHPPPPPPPMFPGSENNFHKPTMSRPASRVASRPQQQGPPESVRGGQLGNREMRGASVNNVEFSDDEIATANASDAPLSIPRPRPLPPPSLPPFPPSYATSNPPRGMSEARPSPAYQTPSARSKHVPRSLTCTSLRQPATGYGLNNALHFTPDLVKQRIPKKKSDQPTASASTEQAGSSKAKPISESDNIERPVTVRPCGQPDEIPIDPALEAQDFDESRAEIEDVMAKQDRQVDTTDDEDDEDDEDRLYRPGRGSTRKTTQRRTAKGRAKKPALGRKDDVARDGAMLAQAA